MALALGCVLVFLSMIPAAAIRAIRNRRLSGDRKPAPRGVRVAHRIIVVICVLNLLFVVGTVLWGNPRPLFGVSIIEHALRNSLPIRERYVKLSSARLAVGTVAANQRVARSGSIVWSNVGATGAALEMIPPTLTVSPAYAPYATPPVDRVNTTVDVDANGGMVIGGLSHHGATWQVEFAAQTPSEAIRLATVAADPLVALAPPARYAELGAFGQFHSGTYDDEKEAYRKWGWTWPTPGNVWSEEHNRPRVQDL